MPEHENANAPGLLAEQNVIREVRQVCPAEVFRHRMEEPRIPGSLRRHLGEYFKESIGQLHAPLLFVKRQDLMEVFSNQVIEYHFGHLSGPRTP